MMASINEPMLITPIPFPNIRGEVYRGSMPWTILKEDDDTISRLKTEKIALIVLLSSEQECQMALGCDLKKIYQENAFLVEHFPIDPGAFPEEEEFANLIDKLEVEIMKGFRVLIHCMEGKRRTGLVIASLAAKTLNISAKDAMSAFTSHLEEKVSLEKYKDLIGKFSPPGVEDSQEDFSERLAQESDKKAKRRREIGKCTLC